MRSICDPSLVIGRGLGKITPSPVLGRGLGRGRICEYAPSVPMITSGHLPLRGRRIMTRQKYNKKSRFHIDDVKPAFDTIAWQASK